MKTAQREQAREHPAVTHFIRIASNRFSLWRQLLSATNCTLSPFRLVREGLFRLDNLSKKTVHPHCK